MKNQSVSAEIIKIYIQETRKVILKLKKNPGNFSEILLDMRMSKDNSRLFGFDPLFRLFKSLEDVFFALKKNDISFTDNLKNLIILTADKILECCKLLEKNQFALNPSVLKNVDVKLYLIYFDKALSGEIFDSSNLGRKENNYNSEKKENQIKADKVIQINSSTLEDVINMQEEMISYSSVIGNQIELLKKAIKENDINSLKDIYKLLSDDSQNLQNNLFILHDHFCSLMKNEDFLKKHEKLTGFFIYSNSEKYFISSEGILDVISVNPENYILKQNQKFIIYENEEEEETEYEKEEIPLYSLSSLLPGKIVKNKNKQETILVVELFSEKFGIIVDSINKFVSIIKKSLPECFKNFSFLQGAVFDEKYEIVPVLNLSEVIKKFRIQCGYDVKKFEANQKINEVLHE